MDLQYVWPSVWLRHYNDVIMSTIAYQTTSLMLVYSIVYSGADQRKHRSSVKMLWGWWDYNLRNGSIILDLMQQIIYFFNTLRPRLNGRRFADDTFKCIFLNENVEWISIKISLKFVRKGPINNYPALVQLLAWRRSGDRPLSEPMMVSLLTHICITRPQWVNDSHFAVICGNRN